MRVVFDDLSGVVGAADVRNGSAKGEENRKGQARILVFSYIRIACPTRHVSCLWSRKSPSLIAY